MVKEKDHGVDAVDIPGDPLAYVLDADGGGTALGVDGKHGDALVAANRRRQWSAPKIEDDDAGDEPALPGSRSSAER